MDKFKIYKDPYAPSSNVLLGFKGETYIDFDYNELSPVTIKITKATTCPDCDKPSTQHPKGTKQYWNYSILCNGELFYNPRFDPNPNIPL